MILTGISFIFVQTIVIIFFLINFVKYKKAKREWKKFQEQLIHSEKLSVTGQPLADIAHEFNNILEIISGNIQLSISKSRIEDNKELIEIFETIDRQITKGQNIVADIMALIEPEDSEKEICDISEIIKDVLKLEKNFFKLENINIIEDYSYTSKVNINKDQIEQVFLNIINNARHAIKPLGKGTISISIKEIRDKLKIYVRDNGIGIDEKTKKKIFEPFFTFQGARSKDTPGFKNSGLGLSISYRIIQNHNGIIDVESKEGEGSTFIITLPINKNKSGGEEKYYNND